MTGRDTTDEILLDVRGTEVRDTYAEAFRVRCARVIVTAQDARWAETAARVFSGYATSVIGCDAEAGIERSLAPSETPDGRPGCAVLLFGLSTEALAEAVQSRAGQCLMTCPTAAAFDGLPEAEERFALGKHLRFFGDGFQRSKLIGGRRYWRVPVMDGEFLVEEAAGIVKAVAGGNIIVQGTAPGEALAAAMRAVEAVAPLEGVITPFPGGIVRSGSKVGSRYKALRASTNDAFCPTLRGRVPVTELHPDAACAYEVVIDGIDEAAVRAAMRAAVLAAAGPGVPCITAGNYGGKLGKFLIRLHDVLG
ncbi:MAG: formylmethanofuran--tetrahydromethanopterin N-formyltransferase [Planctomycetes bacterium]|nr:formylmethanofuran--tetrahydromethanopterin N-formyltransferase [Planctomycetota bacterium]